MVVTKSRLCCCFGRTTFCCCCSVRTGASVIGWFNFIINSLYVGLMVFSLHRIQDDLLSQIQYEEQLQVGKFDANNEPVDEGSGSLILSGTVQLTSNCVVGGKTVILEQCICEENLNFKSANRTVCVGALRDCNKCIMIYVEEYIVPMLYKSLAIPGILLVFSIIWLTAVESRSLRYVRACGFIYIVVIFLQTVLQLGFLGYANQELTKNQFQSISWSVWLVFGIYAALNVYFIPILYTYLKLRKQEDYEGIEQGLLTSQTTAPTPGRPMDVYLEDAFAIDSEGEMDVFRYTNDDTNRANYGAASNDQQPISTHNVPI
uniref:Mucin-17-like n=1 Tax=Phallusia mammillata TaxID=59560 RepID=A0A6F9DKW3_9ASCI|nr:mucin-17-like [Phallusia mammillata]